MPIVEIESESACDEAWALAPLHPAANPEAAARAQRLRRRHWTMLHCALAVIVLSFLLRDLGGGKVAFLGIPSLTLPELCGSRLFFATECPGCGLTRSFLALAAGDLRASWHAHRVGWLIALAALLQIPYRLYALAELQTRLPDRSWPDWCGRFLIAALFLNWLIGR